ncbi:DUF402 domain-containing protein [Asanoa iriomotensis]|nr:DUF402 domain-containing protein [Asanoa iriomotensis]
MARRRPVRACSLICSRAPGTGAWWYVNFQRPCVRGPGTVDTFDLLVDLVLSDDLTSATWKDEDEYADGRRSGLIDAADHVRLTAARERALALAQARRGAFADTRWHDWSPTSDCALPALSATDMKAARSA